ncbi:sensor histidine kinase [Hyalangium versicolor]|uniref:sensor histidine kinase n=1 Tax=Hyalangium versicolor TaxID=2861190 RepID=UPI001CCB7EE3|nr:ATP-binding sensor histidine kinase [Hyalangium versicolor]
MPDELLEIHRCRHFVLRRTTRDGAAVVLKSLREWIPSPHAAALMHHEHAVLRRLDVPGVVRPLALEGPKELPTLVLEDAGGEDAEQRLRAGPFPLDAFLDIALALADTCTLIHARGVVHRALSPARVVLGSAGKVTLVHFSDASTLTSIPGPLDIESAHRLAWISPEQTGRMNRLVDWRSDLYSLGVTLYAMLAGAPPFRSADPLELIHAHLARLPVSASIVNPRVPPLLSAIVQKLLAKMPERRYQSAESLASDLREARRQWLASRTIEPFELGRLDLARELPLPKRLYGREDELALLLKAFARVSSQGSELVLVAGEAGVGKTALVEAVRDEAVTQGGRFVSGKFDLRAANVPYASVLEALRALARSLLSEPEELRAQELQRIREAVGLSGRVLTELVPELQDIFGDMPEVLPPSPAERETRFHLTLRVFVRAVAASRPLVMFLDDLQWADAASLRVLRSLVLDVENRNLLLLGAFRPRQVDSAHALTRTLDEFQRVGAAVTRLDLGPLSLEALVALLADVLRCEPERARPLAELISSKTAGNPFFIQQILRSLQRDGLLVFEESQGTWTWDLRRLERVGITENVVELMTTVIRGLSGEAQQLLQIAACVGKRVELSLLAAVWGRPVDEATTRLGEALREGLLVPDDASGPKGQLGFRFVHDRVQHAAYTLLSEDRRKELHLRIGRALLGSRRDEELSVELFDIADQLNLGAELLTQDERIDLARMNHRAGNRARSSAAYGPALAYFRMGILLLPRGAWEAHHELAFSLHRDAAECAYLTGDHPLCGTLVEEGLRHAISLLEKAELHGIHIMSATTSGDFRTAFQGGSETLRALGVELPLEDPDRALKSERAAIRTLLASRAPLELLDAPGVSTAEEGACAKLLSIMLPATYFFEPGIYALVTARTIRFALEHGQSVHATTAYATYSFFLAVTGELVEAEGFICLALALARKHGDTGREAEALGIHAYLCPWRQPLASCVADASHAFMLASRTGEFRTASYALSQVFLTSFASGRELDRILAELDEGMSFCRRVGSQGTLLYLTTYRQAIRCLKGLTRGRSCFDDADFDEQAFLAATRNNKTTQYRYSILRLQSTYLFRDFAAARTWSEILHGQLHPLVGYVYFIEGTFLMALTLLVLCEGAKTEERAELLTRVESLKHGLQQRGEGCAENTRHKCLLVEAELARLEGRFLDAAGLYDEAIEAAAKLGFLQDEALGNELCGRLYRALGRRRVAELYLRSAMQGWARWGALGKARALDDEFALGGGLPGLGVPVESAHRVALDALSLLKAAETISSEIVLTRLLGKLMEVCIQAAGAERGVLVFEEEGGPFVRAIARAGETATTERIPLAGAKQLPRRLIEHVRRSRKLLVLDDASGDPAFVSEPSLAQGHVKSVLVLPIQRKESLLGTFLFENDLTTHAFTQERVRVLELLSAEIAIALENSLLFEKLKVEVEERTRAEETVRFLANVSKVLAESLDYPTTLRSLTGLIVPTVAEWCIIDVVEETGKIRRVAWNHSDPTKAWVLRALEERAAPDWSSPQPSVRAMLSGQPVLVPQLTESLVVTHSRDAENARLVRELATRSFIAVPLIARGRTLGAITVGSSNARRAYGPSDVTFAEELARRAAMAVDNARLYQEAQEGIRVREEFLGIAAHELKTPITTMRFTLQAFFRRHEHLPEQHLGKVLRTTEKQLDRLLHLVNELLEVSRLHAGYLDLQREQVDLSAVAHEVVEYFAARIAQSGSQVGLRAPEPVVGIWDRSRLEQVVANLLDNALKFGAGKPVTLAVARRDGMARLVVEDHGIGIPPERLPHVFERFERAVSTRHYGGFGLGLYIVRSIVEALGGTVHVKTQPDEGSTFTVELPCHT